MVSEEYQKVYRTMMNSTVGSDEFNTSMVKLMSALCWAEAEGRHRCNEDEMEVIDYILETGDLWYEMAEETHTRQKEASSTTTASSANSILLWLAAHSKKPLNNSTALTKFKSEHVAGMKKRGVEATGLV